MRASFRFLFQRTKQCRAEVIRYMFMTMECPVCKEVFPSSVINAHVNDCLNKDPQADDTNVSETKTVTRVKLPPISSSNTSASCSVTQNQNATMKRKSSAANWDFLKPMRSPQHAGPSSTSPPTQAAKKQKKSADAGNRKLFVNGNQKAETETSGDVGDADIIDCDEDESSEKAKIKDRLKAEQVENTSKRGSSSAGSSTGKSTPQQHSFMATGSASKSSESFAPLAERMRPKDFEDYVGQEKAVGKESMLFSLLSSSHIPSIILWGPPGCGKTTLAKIIANKCRCLGNAKFISLSAAVCGVNEVKETIKIARNDQKMFRKKTVMFLDEIHRFNKAQQDILLPHVEDGTITLIGATTENPSFQVNSALLSRCRVVVLDKLSGDSIVSILKRALPRIGAAVKEPGVDASMCERSEVYVDSEALVMLANLVDGDARSALNGLQMAVESKGNNPSLCNGKAVKSEGVADRNGKVKVRLVTIDDIKEGLQRSHVLYDKTGEEHYNIISALHKSMRGSDASAALYWLARMMEGGENPLYVARRLIRFASEDVGLADPEALTQAVAAYQGCHLIGMPECDVILAQCVVYLARAPKSVEIYKAYGNAKSCVKQHKGPLPSVPLHLRNAPTKLMKTLGYGKDYKYNPDCSGPVDQQYFPRELVGTDFFT